ncbi:D-xylose transporter XylE [Escherichia coli]|uniref:D-xylose transporter XylE n=1 Tax=Escherichia coli TaxID=562 RepID=UPI001F49B05C|nr:D-xylose transporter XylE [Escherichia coli]MCH7091032.1 D-xylose transporter XylE [Escherichia coli]
MNTQYNSSYIFSITLVATLGGLLFGYDTAVISGTVESLNTVFVAPQNLSESAANSLLGFCVASALIGCIIGGALGGYCSNRFGRRDSLKIAAVLFFISGVGSAWPELGFTSINPDNTVPVYLAGYVPEFVIYRIIGGIGVGLASMLSPMYIAELAPAHIRGKLVSFNQFAIIFGQLLVYCVNYFIARSGDASWLNTDGWRYMFASECIPALLFLMLLYTVPESPRWLMSRGKQEQAEGILRKIMGNTLATQAVQEIKHSLDHGRKTGGRLLMFGVGVIVIGVMLSIFQQFVGINVVLYYAPEVFKTLGASTDIALLQTIIVGVINLTFTVLAIMTVDKFGRKPLQIIGALGMAIGMFSLGTAFYTQAPGIVALLSMLFYVAAFAMSWGPVCWVLLSEIFPNAIRGKALAIAVAAQWLANYFVSWTFPMMDKNSWLVAHFHNGFSYWIYGCMGVLAALFMWKFVPETKGKTLEGLEALWEPETKKTQQTATL